MCVNIVRRRKVEGGQQNKAPEIDNLKEPHVPMPMYTVKYLQEF